METGEIGGVAGVIATGIAGLLAWMKFGRGNGSGRSKPPTYVRFDPEDQIRLTSIGESLVELREDARVRQAGDDVWRQRYLETMNGIKSGVDAQGRAIAELSGYLKGRQ